MLSTAVIYLNEQLIRNGWNIHLCLESKHFLYFELIKG